MLHEALIAAELLAERGRRGARSSRCRGSTGSTATGSRARSAASREVFVLEDHAPVGALGDTLRARCGGSLDDGRRVTRVRRRGLAGVRHAARGAALPRARRRVARRARRPRCSSARSGVTPAGRSGSSSPTRSRRGSSSTRGSSSGSPRALGERLQPVLPLPPRGGADVGGAAPAGIRPPLLLRRSLPARRRASSSASHAASTAGSTGGSATTRSRSGSTTGTASTRADAPGAPQLAARLRPRRPAAARIARSSGRWSAGTSRPRRYVPSALVATAARGAAGARAQQRADAVGGAVPRRRPAARAPARRLRRELGPHGRQGRDLAAARPLRRPERADAGRPRPLPRHRRRAGRRHGWPQTDVFHAPRPRAEYEALLRGYGLDPGQPARARDGQHADEHARTRDGSSSGSSRGGDETARAARFSLLFRPHPRDREWRERFAAALERRRASAVQEPSYTDLEELATLLQHGDCVVANAGTILLDALVNDRPAVCVLYDEGAPTRASRGRRRTSSASTTRRSRPRAPSTGRSSSRRSRRASSVRSAQPGELADAAARWSRRSSERSTATRPSASSTRSWRRSGAGPSHARWSRSVGGGFASVIGDAVRAAGSAPNAPRRPLVLARRRGT